MCSAGVGWKVGKERHYEIELFLEPPRRVGRTREWAANASATLFDLRRGRSRRSNRVSATFVIGCSRAPSAPSSMFATFSSICITLGDEGVFSLSQSGLAQSEWKISCSVALNGVSVSSQCFSGADNGNARIGCGSSCNHPVHEGGSVCTNSCVA